jgi:hypothetical protein
MAGQNFGIGAQSFPGSLSPNGFINNNRYDTSFLLLDPVRDAQFLQSGQSGDTGLGCVDNPLFVYTTKAMPGNLSAPRKYPVKFFWLGSPNGTTDANDVFSICVADVNTSAFYPGAPASEWLVNPRIVVPFSRAKADIVTWFDTNYPGGGTGGVGSTGTGTNTAYGTLDGDNSNVGNVSGFDSIDGQIWPIYDRVDNSWLIYFSCKTPNANTLAIYCYKTTDTDLNNAVTSAQFLGGFAPGVLSTSEQAGNATVMSSHRFSIVSPDPYNWAAYVNASIAGKQTGVMLYAYLAFDTSTADHGANLSGVLIQDLHANPIKPTTSKSITGSSLDFYGAVADKLGNISPILSNSDNGADGYVFLYNSPASPRDVGTINNSVILSAMKLVVGFLEPTTGVVGIGAPILDAGDSIGEGGYCRAQFTYLPDGIPKLLYAVWTVDQNLVLKMRYIDPQILSPRNTSRILIPAETTASGTITKFPTFGKKYAIMRGYTGANNSVTAQSLWMQVQSQSVLGATNTAFTGINGFPPEMKYVLSRINQYGQNTNIPALTIDIYIKNLTSAFSVAGQVISNNPPQDNYLILTDIEPKTPDSFFDYLTVNGNPLTPNASSYFASTQTAITANTFTDIVGSEDYSELSIDLQIQTPSGTNPTLQIDFLALHPTETYTLTPQVDFNLTPTPITGAATVRLVIVHGVASVWINNVEKVLGNMAVPFLWQLKFTVGGTNPSFPIIGGYQQRKV